MTPAGPAGRDRDRTESAQSREAWAPGRVNLLGEHIDYHGLPVLPVALDLGIRIRFRPRPGGEVRLMSRHSGTDPVSFRIDPDPRPGPAGSWSNYPRAAMRAVVRAYGVGCGIEGVVESTLPAAVGLSSSSALVVATALALLDAEGRIPGTDPLHLAGVLAEGERFVGTEGGGMDQAASLLGREKHALRIGFDPLSVTAIPFPVEWHLIVADSGVRAEKSGAVREAYNARRRAGEEALQTLGASVGQKDPSFPRLLEALGSRELESMIRRILPDPVRRWVAHVPSEAARVNAGTAALLTRDLTRFGGLLNESHASLRDGLEVSHPAVDRLVDAAMAAGAAGARVTGAGFGGCVIAVCEGKAAAPVRSALDETLRRSLPRAVSPLVFRAGIGAGARVTGSDSGAPSPLR